MNGLLQIPATLTKAVTMANRSLRMVFDSQENLTDEHYAKILAKHDKLGWLVFLTGETQIDPEELIKLPVLKEETTKSPGERLRAVLFIWHQQRGGKDKDFPVFYATQMERLISQVKEKLV